jgi:hypothetical protein
LLTTASVFGFQGWSLHTGFPAVQFSDKFKTLFSTN